MLGDVTSSAKSIKKKTMYSPPKPWSKAVPPSNKRKVRPDSSSDDDEDDVQDISPLKKSASKKLSVRVPDAPLDNISFHSIGNAEKWKYVSQRRISLERELGAGALELVSFVGLC